MTKYAQHVSRKTTPQSEQAHPKQAENNAGGFAFVIDDWARLDRFLILGADGPTYYVGEKKLTKENAACIERCLNADGIKAVNRIVEISDSGRAPKNDPAIFALALAASHDKPEVRKAALEALPKVCRIGTHLFHFAASVKELRGWGRSLRKAMGAWYTDRANDKLAYQVVKYQQRDKWSHRDLLRLAHVETADPVKQAIFRWIVAGADSCGERDVKRRVNGSKKEEREVKYGSVSEALPAFISAFEELKACKDEKRLIQLIGEHRFTHEMIPTEFKNSADVWESLLGHMPMTAMVRSLAKMTQVGLLKPLSAASKTVCEKLADKDSLKKARVHPIALLSALKVYEQGHGERGHLKWEAVPQIVDALDEAFYLSFDTIEPTGKNILLGIDVSGSMDGGSIAGVPGLTPRLAAAAMAMVIARSEKNWHCIGFSSGMSGEWVSGTGKSKWGFGFRAGVTSLTISPKQRLDAVVKTMQQVPMGGTDCALPMLYASAKKLHVDAFVTLTDNETWAGDIHPHQALEQYRRQTGRASKMVVIGMTATEFSIANKDDAGSMDVVGMDTAAPQVIADFIRGERTTAAALIEE